MEVSPCLPVAMGRRGGAKEWAIRWGADRAREGGSVLHVVDPAMAAAPRGGGGRKARLAVVGAGAPADGSTTMARDSWATMAVSGSAWKARPDWEA